MSNLPAYQPVPKYDAHEHELLASPSGLTYPPESSARKHRTTYIFSYQSNDEKAVGLMGRNKQETIDIVCEAFPVLKHRPPECIEFYIGDAKILDSAWPDFAAEPPETLNVYVADDPVVIGGRNQVLSYRQKRDDHAAAGFVGVIATAFIITLFIVWLAGGFKDKPKHQAT